MLDPYSRSERRSEFQTIIGLLAGAFCFPLAVEAFRAARPRSPQCSPVVNAFKNSNDLTDVIVVADMVSESKHVALRASGGWSFTSRYPRPARFRRAPRVARRASRPRDRQRQIVVKPWPSTSYEKTCGILDRVVYHQYRADSARRTFRGIAEHVAKAEKAVDGRAPVKRNRFIKLTGATKSVAENWRPRLRTGRA